MMRASVRLVGCAMVALVVTTSGCGISIKKKAPTRPGATGAATAPGRVAHDPPTKFDPASRVALPSEVNPPRSVVGGTFDPPPPPILLEGSTAFVAAPTRLLVIDTATGRTKATISPRHEPMNAGPQVGSEPAEGCVLVDVDGKKLVVVPFVTKVPGLGTTPARSVLEVFAVAAATGRPVWDTQLELAPGTATDATSVSAAAVGAAGRTVVVRVLDRSNDFARDTYAVDLASRRIAWHRAGFDAGAVAGAVVAGRLAYDQIGIQARLTGLAVGDGRQRWIAPAASADLTVLPGGPTYIVVAGARYSDLGRFLRLVKVATGAAVDSPHLASLAGITCRFDGAAVTVCANREWAGAFDAATGKWLWELPDRIANRVAPTITAVWHGAVYGTTTNGPVVLDARTGADREAAPGAAPYAVDGYVGIAVDGSDGRVYAYRPTG
jgi:outer membrane protein assembly factor BamB